MHTATPMNLTDFTLSKKARCKRLYIVWFYFYEKSRKDQSVETGAGDENRIHTGTRDSTGVMKMF